MKTILDVPISFELRGFGRAAPSHAPVVRARVGGVTTHLIVDTGTTDTVLTHELVEMLDVSLMTDEPGRDHAGGAVETHRVDGDLSLELGDGVLSLAAPYVIWAPPFFTRWHVGGILCPQKLHPGATLVLDFLAMQLELVEGPLSEIDARVRAKHGALDRLTAARIETTDEEAGLIVLQARIAGVDVGWMLNTGTDRCELSPTVAPGELELELLGHGVGGQGVYGAHHGGTIIEVDGRRIETGPAIVRDQGESFQAQLGTDLLRGTILAVSDDTVAWWRAASRRHRRRRNP